MKDQIPTKQFLARKRLSTISEWEEDDVVDRRTDTTVYKTHRRRSASRRSSANELQDSQSQSNATGAKLRRRRFKFIAVLRAAYSGCSESPLKGTPWEDHFGFGSVPLASTSSCPPRRNRKLRRQTSVKEEEECIDFWLKFFG
ncbi:hypothetical protein OS493_027421 [Desmophyllum pertusum]|uniref:Uncharacterized protein n=1 Tax=Desmophyllum pertusum TaxID=174260 RepID=A0A9W9YKV8_9CNID|nr:hypothetical protein OS493_027421 [Desmophyllum pertusum]